MTQDVGLTIQEMKQYHDLQDELRDIEHKYDDLKDFLVKDFLCSIEHGLAVRELYDAHEKFRTLKKEKIKLEERIRCLTSEWVIK